MSDGPRLLFSLAALAALLVASGCEIRSGGVAGNGQNAGAAGDDQAAPLNEDGAVVHRGGIQFVAGYDRGLELARERQMPALVFFTADWCTYCHQMEADAFSQESVVQLAKQFVCVLVDADCEPGVCSDFRIKGYPTIQFLSPRGVPLNRVTGKQPGQQLVMQMQAALQAVARRDGETMQR
jgi:thiol-disulfide isomerase/thioredoxin